MQDNSKELSKSARRVQEALAQNEMTFEVVELSFSTRTANDAANTIGCDVAQIVKSLLFRTFDTNQPVLILASGSNRVNEKIIEALISEKLVKADADFTRDITGFAIGGVPPVGHKQKIDMIFIDEDLLNYEKLWAAAGTPNAVFSFPSNELVSLTGGKVTAIK